MLKAYQSLEPGDFTGFLKLLRSPSSQRLQSRCTAFLNTMEAYHVIIFFFNKFNITLFIQSPPCGMSELIVDSHLLYRICRYRSSRISCKTSTSHLLNILAVSKDQFSTIWEVTCENMTVINHLELLLLIFRFSWGSGHSDNGACGEVNNDTFAQMGFLSRQLRWWTEGPDAAEKNTVTIHAVFNENF